LYWGRRVFTDALAGSQRSEFSFEPTSKAAVQKIFFESKAVVDVEHPKQRGLTMRTIETIGSGTKLVTTNAAVRDYDFYDPSNVCIVDRTNPVVDQAFLDAPYAALPPAVYNRYRLSQWLRDVCVGSVAAPSTRELVLSSVAKELTSTHPATPAAQVPALVRAGAHLRVAVATSSCAMLTSHGTALLLALREAGCRPVILGPQDDDTEQLISQGFDFIQLSTDTWPAHPLLALARVPSLRRALKAGCFDAVFTFTGASHVLFGAAARSLKLPHVPTVDHASDANGAPQRPQLRWLTDRMLSWARWVVLQGTDGGKNGKLAPGGQMTAQPVLRVPTMGVDLDQFAPAAWPDNSSRSVTPGPRYLFIVDTAQIQSVTPLIDAVRQLKAQVPGATVRWLGPLGSPSTGPVSQAQLDEWAAEGLLEYLGAPQDIRPATADADVVVLPSSGSGRLPAALLQACAMGRPCIAADVPMCRAVVDHAVTGLLCDMRSADSLAQTLLQFSALPLSARQQLGQQARMKVERDFDLRAIAGTYTRLAEHLAVEARHRRAA
jgi:glycosyltransferase involved in cell wall biosynthesis